MGTWSRMRARAHDGLVAPVAVVGAGYVGRGLVHRLDRTPGLSPALLVNRTPQHAVDAFVGAGRDEAAVVVSDDAGDLEDALAAGRPAVTTDAGLLAALDVDVVVEATGSLDHAAKVMLDALEAGRHVVSINAEVDATIGWLLHDAARRSGAVYTIADGDQPGVLLRQIDFVEGMGFDVVAAVNCKRHLDIRQDPESSAPYAARDGTSPYVTAATGDGTKMQIEQAVVANVAGLPPERRGMRGITTTMETALRDVTEAISGTGVVEYTLGGDFGAGVFVIGRAQEPEQVERFMRFFKMGDGPDYLFFRPYHLVHLEMPLTIAEVVLDRQGLGVPSQPPVADVVAVAKRDLAVGEQLDGIGGFCCYGQIDTVDEASGLLPMGLAAHGRLTRAVPRDEPIPLDAVELDEEAAIVRLRRRQDAELSVAP